MVCCSSDYNEFMIRQMINTKWPAMKRATIEILHEDEETIFGKPNGKFFVREYEHGEEQGGMFFKTMNEAHKHVLRYQDETEKSV